MAKGSRGGKAGASTTGTSARARAAGSGSRGGGGGAAGVADNSPVTNISNNAPQSMSASFNQFNAMTDDEKADVITNMVSQGVPAHLSDTDFQRFIYNIGLNDKPQLVDDKTLDSMSGTEIFRTVNSVYDRRNDIGYSATEIAKQVQSGRITRTSDNGGSVYGRGIYFATNKSDSSAYGNTRGDVKRTAIMRAKLNSNAKVITYRQALKGATDEYNKGTKLGKALDNLDIKSQASIYALARGYNVLSNGSSYMCVLNRQAMTMSTSVNAI